MARISPSILVKLAFDQGFDLGEGLVGVVAFAMDDDFAARSGGQHHQTHDAFAVDLFAVLFDEDAAGKFIDNTDKHGGGPGMDAQLVEHHKLAPQGGPVPGFFDITHFASKRPMCSLPGLFAIEN
jgi:hypothetical protein